MKKTKIIALLLTLTMLFSVLPLSVLAENGEAEEQPASEETLWETGEEEETLPPEEQPEPEKTEASEPEQEPETETPAENTAEAEEPAEAKTVEVTFVCPEAELALLAVFTVCDREHPVEGKEPGVYELLPGEYVYIYPGADEVRFTVGAEPLTVSFHLPAETEEAPVAAETASSEAPAEEEPAEEEPAEEEPAEEEPAEEEPAKEEPAEEEPAEEEPAEEEPVEEEPVEEEPVEEEPVEEEPVEEEPAEEKPAEEAPAETDTPADEPEAEDTEMSESEEEPAEEETGEAESAEAETPPEETAEPVTDEGWEDFIEALPEPEGEDWNEDLLALAESLIGQGVVEELSSITEDGEARFYTRFGAWMGYPYEPWCASFVSFCLHYAGIPSEAVPRSAGCESWCLALREGELLIEAENEEGEAYIPEPGDLVIFADRPEGTPCHVGIVRDYKSAEYDEEGVLMHDDLLLTIEGNNGPAVAEFEHERGAWGEYAWAGFVSLHAAREVWEREREDEVRAHTAEAEKNLLVCPMLADENTVLWLVEVYDAPMEFRQYTWNGEPMLWSDAHSAWVSCLWSFEMPTAGGLAEVPGRGETLEPGADLNGTGREDLNDVQFLYSIYRESGAAAELDRALCLRCDLDGNGVIDMADVQNLLFRVSES